MIKNHAHWNEDVWKNPDHGVQDDPDALLNRDFEISALGTVKPSGLSQDRLDAYLGSVSVEVNGKNTLIGSQSIALSNINRELQMNTTGSSDRLGEVDRTFITHGQNISRNSTYTENQQTSLLAQGGRVGSAEKGLDNHETRITDAETGLHEADTAITSQGTIIQAHTTRIDGAEGKITSQGTKLTTIETVTIPTAEKSAKDHGTKVAGVAETNAKNAASVDATEKANAALTSANNKTASEISALEQRTRDNISAAIKDLPTTSIVESEIQDAIKDLPTKTWVGNELGILRTDSEQNLSKAFTDRGFTETKNLSTLSEYVDAYKDSNEQEKRVIQAEINTAVEKALQDHSAMIRMNRESIAAVERNMTRHLAIVEGEPPVSDEFAQVGKNESSGGSEGSLDLGGSDDVSGSWGSWGGGSSGGSGGGSTSSSDYTIKFRSDWIGEATIQYYDSGNGLTKLFKTSVPCVVGSNSAIRSSRELLFKSRGGIMLSYRVKPGKMVYFSSDEANSNPAKFTPEKGVWTNAPNARWKATKNTSHTIGAGVIWESAGAIGTYGIRILDVTNSSAPIVLAQKTESGIGTIFGWGSTNDISSKATQVVQVEKNLAKDTILQVQVYSDNGITARRYCRKGTITTAWNDETE